MTAAAMAAAQPARVIRFDGDTPVVALTPIELGVLPAVGIGRVQDGLWLIPLDLPAARRLADAAAQVVARYELLERQLVDALEDLA